MYMMFRNMRAAPGRTADAVAIAVAARDRLNGEHGGQYAVSVNVGNDPSALSLSSPFATLGDYAKIRDAVAADVHLQSLIRMAGDVLADATDAITKVVKAPGDRGAFAQVNLAQMHMPAVTEAVPFAVEVAEYVESKVGQSVGVLTAVTGNRSGLAWIGFTDSLDQMGQNGDTLESDPDYLAFFKRSEPMFVPGSLEQSIWQLLP